jgi:hypothetical protein
MVAADFPTLKTGLTPEFTISTFISQPFHGCHEVRDGQDAATALNPGDEVFSNLPSEQRLFAGILELLDTLFRLPVQPLGETGVRHGDGSFFRASRMLSIFCRFSPEAHEAESPEIDGDRPWKDGTETKTREVPQ